MPLTFQGIENGINIYRDLETGEEQRLVDKVAALGNETEDSDEIASKFGSTTFETDNEERAESILSSGEVSYSKSRQGRKYDPNAGGTGASKIIDPGSAPSSSFNAWNLFRYKSKAKGQTEEESNIPDYNGVENQDREDIKNPTAKRIVNWSFDSGSEGCSYALKDFIQCEHYGVIPNNYMVTLRRFPFPAPDDIFNPMAFSAANNEPVPANQPDIARAITWMSPTLGNELKDIFSFGTGFAWKDVEAQVQTAQSSTDRGKVGSFMESNPLLRAIEAGNEGLDVVAAKRREQLGAGFDPLSSTYPNHVYGPLNVIKSMMVRDRGINFDKEFTLNFYYDMKAYGNLSPKAAFLDTITNLLVLTSNNAPFWGGAARGVSNGKIGKPFGDLSKLASGDYKGFFGGIKDQFSDMAGNFMGEVTDLLQNGEMGDMMNNLVGGQLMDLFGSPQGASVLNAFLTGDPTGQWHVTVGNPMNPAMVVGNLGLQSAKFELGGPLGYEDFPTKLKVTVTLKPGRPRDKAEIESMFNVGKGRMYITPEGMDDIGFYNKSAYGNKEINSGMAIRTSEMGLG